jgi:3-oxoacyl-[acyl-carrier-protein] synthase II
MAWMILKLDLADVVFAGGTEAAITETFQESYSAMHALSTRNDEPQKASRPFDRDRDGFVMGEGCGVLILESLDHARKRGARILAELVGVGMTCDAHHMTANHPDGRGAAAAMRLALNSAQMKPEDVDYISAHGTSTPMNDPIETHAIKMAFGEAAYRVPVSSIKSMIGHCIGASGGIEAATCVMTIQENVIPPTINLDNPDPKCDLDYVPHHARRTPMNVVLSNSFAFGGQNCVLLFKRFSE